MKALIVDDAELSRFSLGRIMAHLGFEPIEAVDAQEALQIIQLNPEIKVVMLRSRKSVVNGYNFLTEIKALPGIAVAPKVLVVGAEVEMPSILKMLTDGADEYIIKPYDREAVARKLKAAGLIC